MGIIKKAPYILVIISLMFWIGCKSQEEVIIPPKSNNPTIIFEGGAIDLPTDSIVIGDALVYRRKEVYNITMLLPLHLDSVFTVNEKKKRKIYGDYVFPPSKMALDFYRGALLALDELEERGFKANINVFDTKRDSTTITRLIKSGKLDSSDLIIGPIYNSEFKQVLAYGNKTGTPIVSPLSPSINISDTSFNYIQMNPALNAHCRKIFDYLMSNYNSTEIVLVFRANGLEIGMGQLFDKWLKENNDTKSLKSKLNKEKVWWTSRFKNNDTSFVINEDTVSNETMDTSTIGLNDTSKVILDSLNTFKKFVFIEEEHDLFIDDNEVDDDELIDRLGITEYFAEWDTNIVVVLSVDYKFINLLNRELSNLTENYLISLYGLPIWGEYQHFRLDYIEKLDVHFTSSKYIDSSFYIDNDFYLSYIDSFGTEPNEIAIKGYDIMNYLGTELYTYGSDFSYYVLGDTLPGISTTFVIKPTAAYHYSTNKAFVPLFLQNNYVHLLKYKGYSIEKVK